MSSSKKTREKQQRPGSKREIVTFRMDLESLRRLHTVSDALKCPPGELIREWVIQRTEQEISRLQIEQNRQIRDIPASMPAPEASNLIASMIKDNVDEQSWEELKKSLDESRSSSRKFFQ